MAKRTVESLALDHLLRRSRRLAEATETIASIQDELHGELRSRIHRRLDLARSLLDAANAASARGTGAGSALAPLVDTCAVGALSACSRQGNDLYVEFAHDRCGERRVRRAQLPLSWLQDNEATASEAMRRDLLAPVLGAQHG